MQTRITTLYIVKALFVLSVLSLPTSCGKFRKLEKSKDWRIKYDGAIAYYDNKDYKRAAILFEQIRPITRGLPEGERVEFLLAYCHYYSKKAYLLAAHQFRLFYEAYGRSDLASEAKFMYAYSLYIASPDYSLDQQSSVDAMEVMQNFINQNPDSKFVEQASEVIVECQKKLEKKNYESAKLYMKIKRYKAALVAFDSFKQNFPDTEYLEEVGFLQVMAQYKLAEKSIYNLRKERYQATIDLYQVWIDTYPRSQYIKEAEKYYASSINKIKEGV